MNGLLCCSALVTALLTAAALLTTSEPIREVGAAGCANQHDATCAGTNQMN